MKTESPMFKMAVTEALYALRNATSSLETCKEFNAVGDVGDVIRGSVEDKHNCIAVLDAWLKRNAPEQKP